MTNARTAKSAREKAAELRAEAAKQEARRKRTMITAAVLAVAVALIGVFVLVKVAGDNKAADEAKAKQPPANLVDGGIGIGQPTAKVKIDLYEDFQCPICQQFETANDPQIEAWVKAGTARVVYHPVSILDRMSSTNFSTRSANASAAVINSSPAAWPAFHKALYANQPAENSAGLPDEKLIELAAAAGADKNAITTPITTQRFASWVTTVTDEFSKSGYTGTPTVVVNGKKLDTIDPATVKTAVDAAAKG
jgi:protein-disulfide isomerase